MIGVESKAELNYPPNSLKTVNSLWNLEGKAETICCNASVRRWKRKNHLL
jgi:hypothetical protein